MLFDDILCQIGEFGIYQMVLYGLLGLVAIPTGWQEFSVVFVAGDQNHWCEVTRLENFTHYEQRCIAIPDVRDNCHLQELTLFQPRNLEQAHPGPSSAFSRCHYYDLDYDKYTDLELERWNRSRMVHLHTPVINCSSWVFETSQFRSTLASDMGLVCEKAGLLAHVQTAYYTGYMMGSLVFGAISDRFGRHKTLTISLFLQIVFGVSAALTTYYPAFLALRFFDATAVAGAYNTAFVMIMEIIGPSRRMGAGIFVQGWYAFGIMTLSGIAYSVRDHKKLQCLLALPVVILLIYHWIVPESPRWYSSHGRFEDGEKVLRRMAEVNGRELPPCLELEENRKDDHYGKNLKRHPCLIDLFLLKNLRIKTCILHFIWFADHFAYNTSVSHMGPVSGNMYLTTFLSGAVELPAFLVMLAIINRVGRRWPTIIILVIQGVVSLCSVPFLNNPDKMAGLTAFSMVGKLVAAAGFASVNVYSAESFPTDVRNSGIGLGTMCGGLGGLLARHGAKDMRTIYPPVPMILASALSVGAAMLAFLLPETSGHNLPETLTEGEAFGRDCISKFLETGHIHKPFIIEREARPRVDLGPACTLKMGALKNDLFQIPQSI